MGTKGGSKLKNQFLQWLLTKVMNDVKSINPCNQPIAIITQLKNIVLTNIKQQTTDLLKK
jgi:hypothetical protein